MYNGRPCVHKALALTGGVQGPALGPLAGCRGRAPAGGPGGGAPGSSRVLDILNLEDGRYFKQNLAWLALHNTLLQRKT